LRDETPVRRSKSVGVDVHEKRRYSGAVDHNPACAHKTWGGPPWVQRMVEARRRKRAKKYYEYTKPTDRKGRKA